MFDTGSHATDAFAGDTPVPICHDAAGLALDGHSRSVYVADGYGGAVIQIDGPRQRRIATIETGGVFATERIAGLVVTPDGTVYVSRIGHGNAGAIFRVEPGGHVEAIDKIRPTDWRGGLAYDAREHTLYAAQYLASARGAHGGSIVAIDLLGGEPSTVIDGFAKPVGVAKLGATLVVSDARQRAVFVIELRRGRGAHRLQLAAAIDRPGAITACGSESVLVATYDEERKHGAIRRLWLDGKQRVVAHGPWEPRGVATDGTRVLVATSRLGRVLQFVL